MRGNPESCELIAANSLSHVLSILAAAPGHWTPIAGGTELMVAHAAGRLNTTKLISLWQLPELSSITTTDNFVTLGGGVTFSQIRRHETILREFPLLARAATWIGSIANQNRATLAGNIINGSPAADAPPALLVYDAEIELISTTGKRRIPYSEFHLGYKRNVMRPDELVFALHLPRRFANHTQYLRKVGTRRAMAVTKVALAATATIAEGRVAEIRIAAASIADRPVRALATEQVLLGQPLSASTIAAARTALMREAQPIDDIRSTADYRRSVAANLLEEFLARLQMQNSTILQAWNKLPTEQAIATLLNCCASTRWASTLTASRPFADEEALVAAADAVWSTMQEPDWHEAFAAHPRIGARKANHASPQSLTWSQQEQSSTSHAESRILAQLAEGNARYESIFGFTYIVCATGKSAEQMLSILQTRLTNDRPTELKEAAEQQRQIMHIRLRKWLHP